MYRTKSDYEATESPATRQPPDSLALLVAARLSRSGYAALSAVACEFRAGVAVLSGTVPSFHLKQVAGSLAAHTPGVRQVENCLHVAKAAARSKQPK